MKKETGYQKFGVSGAGEIVISENIGWACGTARGFSFSVSWGKHGEAGGVIDEEDAVKLAKHILKAVKKRELTA